MKQIKYIAGFLVCLLILSSLTPNFVFADEDDYSELIAQRQAYFEAKHGNEVGSTWGDFYWLDPYVDGAGLTVLLYTDAAKEWTFDIIEADGYDNGDHFDTLTGGESWFHGWLSWFMTSPEIDAAIQTKDIDEWRPNRLEYNSHLRKCIQYFGITKEELKEANRKMQEEPDSIRTLFPFLTDDQFEYARQENGLFCYEPLADFMIEALYLEDDEAANNLLCEPYAVYVKDLDRAVALQMLYDGDLGFYDILACDLTSDWMGRFLEIDGYLKYSRELILAHDRISAAREAQLAAAETGDGAVTAVWVIALAVPTLVAVVTVKRKRRI